MPRKVMPLRRNTQPVPTATITRPATAGPIMRAPLNEAAFSATALDAFSRATRSDTNACRAGLSNAETTPRVSAKAYMRRERHDPLEDQDADHDADHQQQRLGDHEQTPAVEPVGDPAGRAHEQQRRSELQRHRDAHRGGVVVGELGEHDPAERRRLHPRADVRHERADEPDPVVEDREGAEHRAHRAATASMISAASASRWRCCGVSAASASSSQASRRRTVSSTTSRPASVSEMLTLRRSSMSGVRAR